MKAAILLVFFLALAGGHAAAAFTPERLREIFSFDSRSPEDDEQLFNMVSREELVEWARIGLTHESPASLARVISITGSRYQRYSDDLTDREKDEIVDCIIKTSERHIALTGSYGSLGKLGAFVHPKMDAYVEKMRGVPNEDAKYSVNSLEIQLAAERDRLASVRAAAAKRAAAFRASATLRPSSGVSPESERGQPPSDESDSLASPMLWLMAAAVVIVAASLVWALRRPSVSK